MKLLLSQKNKLFDIIEKQGLTPGLFEFNEIEAYEDIESKMKFLKPFMIKFLL